MRADDYISSVVGPCIFFYLSHSYVAILFFFCQSLHCGFVLSNKRKNFW